MRTLAAIGCLAFALPAQIVNTVISNGTVESRYDIVILGDGYQAGEQSQFDQDVSTFLTALFNKQPYSTFADYYNVHTVFRASLESGADRPDETPPVFVDTAYDATYDYGGVDRCLYIQNTSQALADAALAPATEGRVLVMVNDSRYGGCASVFAVSYNGSQMSEVQAHELGHSLGQLADEYDYPNGTYTGGEPASPNVTADPVGSKWSIWHGTQGIGAFEGAGYYQFGLFRPRNNCLMRSLGNVLCRVCQENIVKVTNAIVDVITSTSPATTAVLPLNHTSVQPFSFTHFVPVGNNPLIEWRVDGALQAGATTTTFAFDAGQFALGPHTIEATIVDRSDRVRSDPMDVMHESVAWQVLVSNPTLCQLRIDSNLVTPVIANPGDQVTATPAIHNDGPAAAGAFDVELFLSSAPTWSLQDTFLGRATIAGLAAGQTVSLTMPIDLPWSMPTQLMYVHTVVDRVDAVAESDESDNSGWRVVFGQPGPCATGLEFQDQLVAPRSGELSLQAGGTVHPTVVAPCADPATTLYLVVWGGSGTSPGLPLGGGLVLPIQFDGLSQLGLDGLNGAVFGQFLGTLDAQGIGRAQFSLPPSTALATGATHFATVLLGDTQLFTAVSNAIELTLLP